MKAFEELKIGCIGTGTMGGALISAMTKIVKPENIFVSSGHYENAKAFAEKNHCIACKQIQKQHKKRIYCF